MVKLLKVHYDKDLGKENIGAYHVSEPSESESIFIFNSFTTA